MPCCVLSVEKAGEGSWGEIRIVVANRAYRDTMGPAYHDNMIYSELVPQDNKFEDYCYRAAVLKQRMHAYDLTKINERKVSGNEAHDSFIELIRSLSVPAA